MLSFLQQAARLHRKAAAKDGPLSAVLAVILCASLASPAFAAEIGHEGAVRQMAAREIESETARMLSSVAVQLEAQGQLDMLPIFEAIIADEVEARISAKYNLYPASNSESVMFYFPNGGAVGYEGPFYTTVLHTYMTPAMFIECIDNPDNEIDDRVETTIGNIIDIIDNATLSGWADAIGLLVDLKVAADEEMRQRVRDTGGYADVMVVSDASGIETATAIMVWDDRPFATVTPYSDDYFVQTF